MDKAPDSAGIPADLQSTGDPCKNNPYPKADRRHEVWKDATRRAEEEVFHLNSAFLKTPKPDLRAQVASLLNLASGKYDIWAKRGVCVIWDDDAIPSYDQWLFKYAEDCLQTYGEVYPELRRELRDLFIERMQYWKAEVRRYVALQGAYREGLPPKDQPAAETADDTETGPVESGIDEIKAKRRAMLEDYKAATNNPSNKKLYEAKNSGIHKPDFYAWLNGVLAPDSAMSINFERFLRLKKPPYPRRPKG